MQFDALAREWDAAVIGAGVAGAMAALHLARAGMRVLLIEKATWPRDKVCGGCLNAAALRALAAAGITDLADGGRAYKHMRLACSDRQADVPLTAGLAVRRARFDALLVEHAVKAGVFFMPATRARLGAATATSRAVELHREKLVREINAKVVLDCAGLASRLLPRVGWKILRDARIGVGASVRDVPEWYRAGVIHMACAQHGYAGLVRADDGQVNVAAALDPSWTSRIGGPAGAVAEILSSAGFPAIESLETARWQGTPQLTKRRQHLGAERVFILGDAAGYAEPFTGEGMAWALAEAAAIAPHVLRAANRWHDQAVTDWSAQHARLVRAHHRVCVAVSMLMRRPRVLSAMLPLINAAPGFIAPLSKWLNRDLDVAAVVQE